MKKALILLILIPVILTSCKNAPLESEIISNSEAYTTVVYITKTGECYHNSSCSSLRKSKIKKKLSDVADKYRPCQNCYPPTVE